MRNPDPVIDSDLSPALDLLEAHWRALRGPRAMPSRGEIVAQAIEPALPFLFIAAPVAPAVLRIRHAGHRFMQMAGMEPRGMPFCAFFTPEGRAALRPALAALQERPALLRMGLVAGRGIVTPRVAARLLILPLSDTGLRADTFVGALVGAGQADRRPLRFDIDSGPMQIEQLRPAGLMPRLVAAGGRRRPGAEHPGLRLVVAND